VEAALIRAPVNSDLAVRAATILVRLDVASPQAVAALIHALGNRDNPFAVEIDRRREAVAGLGQLGHASPRVAVALIWALGDLDHEVRQTAVSSLVELGQSSPEVVAALIRALGHESKDALNGAAESLCRIGKLDESQLQEALRRLDRRVHDLDKSGITRITVIQTARRLLTDRPMPGQRWVPIREREKRRCRRLAAACVVAAMAVILLAVALRTLAQEWLGVDSRIVALAAAIGGLIALLAAVTEILGYLRGKEKR
jgi:HEAT repeat protein